MRSASIFFIVVLGTCAAAAASAADLPPAADTAGAEESRFRREREARLAEEAIGDALPDVPEAPPVREAAPADDGRRFAVREVSFSGNYSLKSEELAAFTRGLEGREVSLAEVQAAVDAVKRHYRSKGFVASYAYVPPQRIEDGALRIDVIEGRLGELRLAGNRRFGTETLRRVFRLKPGEVIRYEALRRDLARLNAHPDVEAKATLAPGGRTGTTDVEVAIEETPPYFLRADLNNFGTKNTGKTRYGLSAGHTNLFGRLDELTGTAQFGKHASALGLSYETPVGPPDWLTRAGYAYANAKVDVAGDFAALNAEGDARTHSLYLERTLREGASLNVEARGGLDWKSVENRLLGNVSGEDELRVPFVGLQLDQNDDGGRTLSGHSLHFGLADFLGSSSKDDARLTRAGTGEFFAYRGSILRLQRLPRGLLGSARASVQLSPDALPPSEQFRLGGAHTARGYQEGEYLGDTGGALSLDLYAPPPAVPDAWRLPFSSEPLNQQVQLILFADVGHGKLKRPLAGERKDKTLADLGAGLRVHLYDKVYGRIEWGFPVGDRPFDSRDSAVYFSVSVEPF